METGISAVGTFGCILLIMLFFVTISMTSAIKVVPESQRLEVYRLGRYIGRKGPGLVMVLPIIDKAFKVDAASPEQEMARATAIPGMPVGQALTPIQPDGEVQIDGKVWSATSVQPIPAGAQVRVRRVILEVEKI
jgi:regulator of protease activity HflC (stomatin/prohibitin superfamily)